MTTLLQRKDPRLPVYLVVPHALVAPWRLAGTTVVEGSVNGHGIGRRTLKRWDSSADADWFLELTAPFCQAAGLAVGDTLRCSLVPAGTGLPDELQAVLDASPVLARRWQALSDARRRVAAEHVRAAKSPATRERRAARVAEQLGAASGMPG